MKTKVKPIKKASSDPVREAEGHPSGPSLTEMLYGEEEKVLEKRERTTYRRREQDDEHMPAV